MLAIDFTTNPIDHVQADDRWIVRAGQTRMKGPLWLDGELLVEENGHLIIED